MTDAPKTVPVVSIVGKGDSGKTTFLEKLIAELSSRGVRVATVKHHVHDYDIDVPGKDSWRHARAGAVTTMVSSPDKFALIRQVEREFTLPELATMAAEAGNDVLLTEGFKREATTRIEISRKARSEELISTPDELLAVVTDNSDLSLGEIPKFALDDAVGVADLIQARYLREARAGVPRAVPQERSDEDCLSTAPLPAPTAGTEV